MSSYFPAALSSPMASTLPDASTERPQPPIHRRTLSEVESADLEGLEKENFDLKLRLYYLEEKTRAGLPLPNQLYTSLMQNAELQSHVNELEEELETKNQLLVKARSVIESLNSDVSSQKQSFLQERAQLQTEMNDRVHAAIHSMEAQLIQARSQTQDALAKKLSTEEELSSLRLVLSQMEFTSAGLIKENQEFSAEIQKLSASNSQKDAQIQKHLDTLTAREREQSILLAATMENQTKQSVPREEWTRMEEKYSNLLATHSTLEQQMAAWRDELQVREQEYKSTAEKLHTTQVQLQELRDVRTVNEELTKKLQESQLQCQSLLYELESSKQQHATFVREQESRFQSLLGEDDRRIQSEWTEEKQRLESENQKQREALEQTYQTSLRQQEESNRLQFQELQDLYQRQLLESQAKHERALEELKQQFDQTFQAERTSSAKRIIELTTGFETELAASQSRYAQELKSQQEQSSTQISHLEKQHHEELTQMKINLNQIESAFEQAKQMWEQERSHLLSDSSKETQQREQIRAIEKQQEIERFEQLKSQCQREIETLQAQVKEELSKKEQEYSFRMNELIKEHSAELAQVQQRERTLESNLQQQLDSEREAHSQQIAQLHSESTRAQEALLNSVEQQWREKENQLQGAASNQHQKDAQEIQHLQSVLRVSRQNYEQLERTIEKDYVRAEKAQELGVQLSQFKQDLKQAKAKLADTLVELERLKGETVSLTLHQQLQDELEKRETEISQLREALLHIQASGAGRGRSLSASPVRGSPVRGSPSQQGRRPTSPILQLAMYPSTPGGSQREAFWSRGGGAVEQEQQWNTSAQVAPMEFITSNAVATAAQQREREANMKQQLRKAQSDNRALTLQIVSLKRRIVEAEGIMQDEMVDRTALVDAQEELESAIGKLKRREGELRALRELVMVPGQVQTSQSQPDQLQQFAAGMGIEVSSLSPQSSPVPSSSPNQVNNPLGVGAADQTELLSEITRLTKALKSRSVDLAAAQSKVRDLMASRVELEENTVPKQLYTDLEQSFEHAQRELSRRDGTISAMQTQMDHLSVELRNAEEQVEQLKQEMEQLQQQHTEREQQLHKDLQTQLDALGTEATQRLAAQQKELEEIQQQKEAQIEELKKQHVQTLSTLTSNHTSQLSDLSKEHQQLLQSTVQQFERQEQEAIHDHARQIQELEREHSDLVQQMKQEFQEQKQALQNRLDMLQQSSESQSSTLSERKQELESLVGRLESRLESSDGERSRLELLVATISQHLSELANVTGWSQDGSIVDGVAEGDDAFAQQPDFQPNLTLAQGNTLPKRTPSRSPRRGQNIPASSSQARTSNQRPAVGGFFSPERSPLGRSRGGHGQSEFGGATGSPVPQLFQSTVPGTPFNPSNLFQAHLAQSIQQQQQQQGGVQESPLTLPMSPERFASGSVQQQGSHPMSVAPHATSITTSMQKIFSSSMTAKERLIEQIQTAQALREEIEETIASHATQLEEIAQEQLQQEKLYEQSRENDQQELRHEKDTFLAQLSTLQSKSDRDLQLLKEQADKDSLALQTQAAKDFAALQAHAAQESKRAEELLSSTQATHAASLERLQSSFQARESDLSQQKEQLIRDVAQLEHALQARVKEVEGLKNELATAKQAADKSNEESSALISSLRAQIQDLTSQISALQYTLTQTQDAKRDLASALAVAEAHLSRAPTPEQLAQVQEKLRVVQEEKIKLEQSLVSLQARLADLEVEKQAYIQLKIQHSSLESSLRELSSQRGQLEQEKRDLLSQLEHLRLTESDNSTLQQRIAAAERRTQLVAQEQQHHVQVTKRVLMELCEVLHAAKIPLTGHTDAATARVPGFLLGGNFHYPDDAEQAVKWVKGKVHELQRVRRAFEYTLHEVEEKYNGNFQKLAALLEQRGAEINVLQRRLLTALGQTTTVTGTLKWK